jgi:hypothetical protein
MARRSPGQARLSGTSLPVARGRVRVAAGREIANARGRGVEVSPLSVTVIYELADALDAISRTDDDKYLRPQLVARLLEERRAANVLPAPPVEAINDEWAALSAELAAAMGDPPPA